MIKCYQVAYIESNDGIMTLAQFDTPEEMTAWFNDRWKKNVMTIVVNITAMKEEP